MIAIAYEDAHLIVVDKPAGLVVHPATGHAGDTLEDRLRAILSDNFFIVHRLDKGTSGLLLVARDAATNLALVRALERREIERRYLAIVDGAPPAAGVFDTPYGRDRRDGKRFTSRLERIAGEPVRAVTRFAVVERLHGAALVEVALETGRTHQIRVHFRDAGHALLGDDIYCKRPRVPLVRGVAAKLERPALHARSLVFVHPATGNRVAIEAAVPDDLARALASLRRATLRAPEGGNA